MPESVAHGSNLHQAERAEAATKAADASVRRILVYRIGSIGDTIIALPAVRAVSRHFPRASLSFLGNAHEKGHVLAQSVLPPDGLFEEWLTYPTGVGRTRPSKDIGRLLLDLRRRKFDTLVYLAPRGRTHVWRDLAFFYAAGIRRFIGHQGIDQLPARVLGQPQTVLEHEADHLLHRLQLSGIPVPPPGEGEMDLGINADEKERARAWLREHCGEALELNNLVGIAPGSNWQSKTWPEERFAELGARLISELKLFPLVLGGPEDYERNERLIALWGRGANAAGQLSVRLAAAALSECRFYVGNDTGTTHLAAAVGTPCVVAFSAQDWPGRWYPYGRGHTVIRRAVACAGCMLRDCDQDLECLKQIEVGEVFDACRAVLMKDPNAKTRRHEEMQNVTL
ncbi:MAG: glycosyltransferase family 9 protein [Acidobacteria bacterium]|nr:glycosyltransferase family 9 protein [Acidobacteriota bacterium]